MSQWFYAAWALAVALAFVLPLAVPFAIWPPREGRQSDLVAECGRRAENNAATETPFIWMPLSSDVQLCGPSTAGVLIYRAEIQARGPYGIPYASGTVDLRVIKPLRIHSGVAIGIAALFGGVTAVSVPFFLVWLRRVLRHRA